MADGRRQQHWPGRSYSWNAGFSRANGAEAPDSRSTAAAGVRCGEWLRRGAAALFALGLAALIVAPAGAHGPFRDGDPADLVADLLINFAVPLVVLVAGAAVGIGLSKWLARNVPNDEDEDGELAGLDDAVGSDETTVRRA